MELIVHPAFGAQGSWRWLLREDEEVLARGKLKSTRKQAWKDAERFKFAVASVQITTRGGEK